jgi:hypothetical protein
VLLDPIDGVLHDGDVGADGRPGAGDRARLVTDVRRLVERGPLVFADDDGATPPV